MGRLAHSIHAKSAPQAYRAGDNERCGLLCCVAQSLVRGMYRQRLQLIYALLGTPSAAIKARSLACIAKPAAHTHSLAPPHQVSPRGRQHRRLLELRRRRPSAGTPGRLIGCSRVRSLPAPAVETRTIQAAKAPRHMGSHLFRVVFAGSGITLPSRFSAPNNCAFSASR